eukprot:maker-scaffold1590_size34775-snap-gene-0.6 protein:Tk12507 transcript:maker-scaffold1590_size34775-snap-gene-0.6-mRNA-1 annotation:"heme-binding protein 2-like"
MKLIPALIALIHFGCVLGLPAVDSGGFNRIIAYTTSLFDEFVSDYVEPKYEVVRTIADGETVEPPRPNSAKVEIQRTPETTVFTRRVGGYMRGNAWENEFEELKAVLEANNIENFETSYYYVNGYDSPWKFFNRRNEVWIVKN